MEYANRGAWEKEDRPTRTIRFLNWLSGRWLAVLFSTFSALYGLWFVFNMDLYLPWQVRLTRATEMTILGHSGLWLAMIRTKTGFRFMLAACLLPSMLVIFFLWWNLNLALAIGALGYMSWIMRQTVGGRHLGN